MSEVSRSRAAVFALLAYFQSGCTGLAGLDAVQGPSLTLTTTENAQAIGDRFVQEREFSASESMLFASVMSVLADLGFRPTHADANTGFITASGSGQERITLEIGGLARSADQTVASVFIDRSLNDSSIVRVIFARSRAVSAKGETAQRNVRDPEPYQAFFSALQAEIEFRNKRITNPTSPLTAEAFEEPALHLSKSMPIVLRVTADLTGD